MDTTTKKRLKLSIFSCVKNEEIMVEDSLKSMKGADEIIIVDTGSTDKTIEIAKKYTDKIYTDYKWNDNFAEAKNYAMSKCTGDWIMGLDADCRLEKGGIEKIRKAIEKTESDILSVRLTPSDIKNKDNYYHYLPKVFRASAGFEYVGRVHEFVKRKDGTSRGNEHTDITITYLYSPNHHKDPDRNLRILLQEVKDNPTIARWKFYLGREYSEKKEYIKAIWWLNEYLKISHYPAEISNAYFIIAKCYWNLFMAEDARMLCSQAIRINPDFKEALLLMAEMHYSPMKERWLSFAEIATNKNVLFVKSKI